MPKRHTIRELILECLTSDHQPEGEIARYVRRFREAEPREIAVALRLLRQEGLAEAVTPLGYKAKHWRRAQRRAA